MLSLGIIRISIKIEKCEVSNGRQSRLSVRCEALSAAVQPCQRQRLCSV